MEDDEIITINARAKGPRRPRGSTGPKQSRQTNGDDDTDWVKTEKSKQDEINSDPELVQQKLEDFEQILPEEYVKMQTGTFIRYLTFDDQQKPQLRLGGYLIKNAAPEYWVLKCGGKGKRQVTWSVPLQPRPDRPSNVYYRRKGVLHCKEDKIRYGAEMYECVASGRKILVDPNEIEKMSGAKVPGCDEPRKSRPKIQLQREDDIPSQREQQQQPRKQEPLQSRSQQLPRPAPPPPAPPRPAQQPAPPAPRSRTAQQPVSLPPARSTQDVPPTPRLKVRFQPN